MKEGKLSVGQISNFLPHRCVRLGIFRLLILSFPGKISSFSPHRCVRPGAFFGGNPGKFPQGRDRQLLCPTPSFRIEFKRFPESFIGKIFKKIWKVSTVERQAPPLSAFSYTILQNWISKISGMFPWEDFLNRFLESFNRPADFSPCLKHILKAGDAGDMLHANFWGFSSFPLDKIN